MRFAALRAPWYKGYLAGSVLMMGGDNLEHAITYWVMWQTFHSPVLAGLAVLTPLAAASVLLDPVRRTRRPVRLPAPDPALGPAVHRGLDHLGHPVRDAAACSPGSASPCCCVHGFASAIWKAPDQLMLYDMVGPTRPAERRAADRDRASRSVSWSGPRSAPLLLFTVGPTIGMFLNVAMYLPFLVYLFIVPITGHLRDVARRAAPHLRDIVSVLRDVPKYPSILVVMILQGAVALFIGVALMPLLPEFGSLLGQGVERARLRDPGVVDGGRGRGVRDHARGDRPHPGQHAPRDHRGRSPSPAASWSSRSRTATRSRSSPSSSPGRAT